MAPCKYILFHLCNAASGEKLGFLQKSLKHIIICLCNWTLCQIISIPKPTLLESSELFLFLLFMPEKQALLSQELFSNPQRICVVLIPMASMALFNFEYKSVELSVMRQPKGFLVPGDARREHKSQGNAISGF